MTAPILNAFDGNFEIEEHDLPMFAKPNLQGRFNRDDRSSREMNKANENLKHGATARNVITSF